MTKSRTTTIQTTRQTEMSEATIEQTEAAEHSDTGGDSLSAKQKPRNQLRTDRGAAAVMLRNVVTIAKRELASYFNSPLAYIVIALSFVGFGFYFFLYQGGFWDVGRVTMVRLFEFAPKVLCLLTLPLFT